MDVGILIGWTALLGILYAASRADALHGVWLAAIAVITISGAVGLLSAL
jgi:hypothetical protein